MTGVQTCALPISEKRPKELSRPFHGNGIKINLGVLANSREGETRQLGCKLTDSEREGPEGTGLPLRPTAAPCPLPISWGTRADD